MKRLGLVGYGLGGSRFHAPLIAAADGLELAAIVTSDPGRAAAATDLYPAATVVSEIDELLEIDPGLDAVVVAAPNRHHVDIARRLIGLGIAVVVDKPLALDAGAAQALVDEARAGSVPLTVFQNRRWDGDFLTVSRLLGDGVLGRVSTFESRFDKWAPTRTGRVRESGDPADGGGLLLDLGSHLVDQALRLFGPVESVEAQLRAVVGEADDEDSVTLHHAGGVVSRLGMSVLGAMPVRRFTVSGSEASYVKSGLDVQEEQLARGMVPGDPAWGVEDESRWGLLWRAPDRPPETVETIRGSWPDFYQGVAAMLEGGAAPVDPAEAVMALEVIDAARISSAEGRAVAPAAN